MKLGVSCAVGPTYSFAAYWAVEGVAVWVEVWNDSPSFSCGRIGWCSAWGSCDGSAVVGLCFSAEIEF